MENYIKDFKGAFEGGLIRVKSAIMGLREFHRILLASLTLWGAFSSKLVFADGMLWSDADLAVWVERAANGPYRSAGDSFDPLVPGEWERIESNAAEFRDNPAAERKSSYAIGSGSFRPDVVKEHDELLDAAFYALVKGDAGLAAEVKEEILWHAANSNLQISRSQYIETDLGNWWMAAWVLRLTMAADFVKESFTASERATFDAWVADWAYAYEGSVHYELSKKIFGKRYERNYTSELGIIATTPYYNAYAYKDASGKQHNQIASVARHYNNRRTSVMEFVGLAGIWLDDPVLIDRGKLYFEEWLQFSVFPDGSVGEYERNKLSGNINQGLIYNSANIEAAVALADALARRGDTSLYEYETRNGLFGSESEAGEGAKSIRLVVETHLDLIEGELDWYHAEGPIEEDYRIDGKADTGSNAGRQWISEIYFAPMGNRYWKSDRIKKGYTRTAAGSIAYSQPFGSAGPYGGPWSGHQVVFPSVLFMFAEMEDVSGSYSDESVPPVVDEETEEPEGNPDAPEIDPVVDESEAPFDLVYATTYNREYDLLDNSVITGDVYVAVKPHGTIQSVVFYDVTENGVVSVNTESYSPFDYIQERTPLRPEDLVGGMRTVIAEVVDVDGKEYRLEATVYSEAYSEDPIEEETEEDVIEELADEDRLPDDWEELYFGGVNAELGGEDDDFDGDSMSNYDEWVAGTDPTDATDYLGLEPVLGVTWKSRQDRSYRIEYTDDNWSSSASSEVLVGNGDTIIWVDPAARDVSHNRQYRIVVVNN